MNQEYFECSKNILRALFCVSILEEGVFWESILEEGVFALKTLTRELQADRWECFLADGWWTVLQRKSILEAVIQKAVFWESILSEEVF